ncbi:MAG TPA: TonB-dependent receptor, partial [Vicinamibacterales bacterium]|nr:TonB-dependent receptor [Vicinamibacterales bacterium]
MKKTFPRFTRMPVRGRNGRTALYPLMLLGTTLATSSALVAAPQAPASQGGGAQRASGAQDTRQLQFKIAAGPLDTALAEFQRITGINVVLADAAIGTLQSPGVSGSLTPARAMEALLSGTGVRATFSENVVQLALRGISELVNVEAPVKKLQSPKYSEPVLDTPQTVVIIPRQVYESQGAVSLRDVLRNTPGITMSIGEGGSGGTSSGDNILIRGFSARNDIYVDGVRDPGMVNRDAFDTEAVEVAKGPNSVIGGRGVTGGSINMVTKVANLEDEGSFRATGGNGDYRRTTMDVNRRLSPTSAIRFNAMWQDTGYPGRDVAEYKSWGVAPSLSLGLNTPTQVTLNYSHMQQNNIPDWGIPTLLPDVAIAQGITVNNLNFSNFYGIASRDYEITRSDIATATVTHKFDRALTLRNLTRYGKNYRDAVLTPPRPANPIAGQGPEDPGWNPLVPQIRRTDTKYQHRNDQVVSNQTDLQAVLATGQIRQSVDIGIELTRDIQPTYAFTDSFANGRPPVDDLFNPTPYVSYTPSYVLTGATSDAHANTAAAYAFDTVKLNEHVQVDLGVRLDHVTADYVAVAAATATGPGPTSTFGRTDNAVTGRTGVVYKPVERGSLYAAYATSFAPSFDGTLGLTIAATGVNGQALPPERTRDAEVGTKWDLTKTLEGTVAVFDMEKTNAKTTDETGATVLAGDQRVLGVEFGLSGNL